MWTSVQRILKPHQRFHVANLGPVVGEWTTEDQGKASVPAQRVFPFGTTAPDFQRSSGHRRQEVEDWLTEAWEDIPPITLEEVQ